MTAATPSPDSSSAEKEREFSLTVSRALQVLCAFDHSRPELGISELSRELSLSKPAVQRLVHALERHLFLEQNPETRKYRIGIQAFRVGSLFAQGRQLERIALPFMQRVVSETRQTCYLSVLRNDEMVITASLEGSGPIRYSIPVGRSIPAHSSATGKAALSALPRHELDALLDRIDMTRRTAHTITDRDTLRDHLRLAASRGYAVNWEENNPGVASVAAPIRDHEQRLVAVLSVGFASSQIPKGRVPGLGRLLAELSAGISAQLSGFNPRRAA